MGRAYMMGEEIVEKMFQNERQEYGRNLLLNSNDFSNFGERGYLGTKVSTLKQEDGYTKIKTTGGSSTIKIITRNAAFLPENGKNFTVSFDVINHSEENLFIRHHWSDGYTHQIPGRFEGRITFTGVRHPGDGQIQFRAANLEYDLYFEIKDMKIETGTKATDWTPAPEDLIDSLKPQTYPLAII